MNDARHAPLKLVLTLFACALSISLAGCADSGPKLYKVTGNVKVDGQPAQSAMVVFTSTDGSTTAAADLNSDGAFEMMTGGVDPGLLPGNYSVQIIRVDGGSVEEGEQEAPPSNVPPKYAEAATSGLTATVEEKDNVIDFTLESS